MVVEKKTINFNLYLRKYVSISIQNDVTMLLTTFSSLNFIFSFAYICILLLRTLCELKLSTKKRLSTM